jgi:hypothetical protein
VTEVEVFQPPQKGYHCRVCGAKLCHTNRTGLCQRCNARKIGAANLAKYNKRRGDEK